MDPEQQESRGLMNQVISRRKLLIGMTAIGGSFLLSKIVEEGWPRLEDASAESTLSAIVYAVQSKQRMDHILPLMLHFGFSAELDNFNYPAPQHEDTSRFYEPFGSSFRSTLFNPVTPSILWELSTIADQAGSEREGYSYGIGQGKGEVDFSASRPPLRKIIQNIIFGLNKSGHHPSDLKYMLVGRETQISSELYNNRLVVNENVQISQDDKGRRVFRIEQRWNTNSRVAYPHVPALIWEIKDDGSVSQPTFPSPSKKVERDLIDRFVDIYTGSSHLLKLGFVPEVFHKIDPRISPTIPFQ